MKKIFKFLMIIFVLVLIFIIYSRYVGTYGFITKEYTFEDNISSSYDGIKIVHFSDIHYNRAIYINKVNDIVEEINLINPDIVVFTGDLIDIDVSLEDSDYNDLINSLSKINSKYGKYAVIGEDDYKNDLDKVIDVLTSSGFIYLDNDYDIIYNKNNDKIFIGGINSLDKDIDKMLSYFNSNEDDNIYKIVLTHYPDDISDILKKNNVNLVLAGHSHNGQINIPFIGAIYTPIGSKKYYDEYYKIDDTNLYISSGIGVSTINYRFNNRPSINFYRINKK